VMSNTQAVSLFGYNKNELIGMRVEELVPEHLREHHSEYRAAFAKRGKERRKYYRDQDLYGLRKDGTEIPIAISLAPIEPEADNLMLTTITDITVRKEVEVLKTGQKHILELISQGNTSLPDILNAILNILEEQHPGTRTTILYVHDNKLYHAAATTMPDAYNKIIDGMEIGPSAGSCGTAAYRGERVIVEDVVSDPLWTDYRQLAEEYGFRACWSEPILDIHGEVVATLTLYHEKPGAPNYYEIQLIDVMSRLISIAIERKRTDQTILESNVELRNLTAKLHTVREEERTTISREIHDELGQVLTGLRMDMTWLLDELPGSRKLQKRVQQSQILVDKTIDTVRRISHGLRPAMLDDLGLAPAIEDHLRGFKAHCSCDYDLILDVDNIGIEKERDTVFFRILQETLTNVARHADANYVTVILQQQDDNLMLTVEDNGIGIDEQKISSKYSIGLIGMRERASSAGGELHIRRGEPAGTYVNLIMPMHLNRA